MSGIAADVVGGAVQGVVEGVGNVLDRLFTSDEERAKLALARLEIERLPALKQIEINLAEGFFHYRAISILGGESDFLGIADFQAEQFALEGREYLV